MKKTALLILALASLQAHAQTEFKTRTISIFKDGSSFVQKQGKVNTANGVYKLIGKEVPQAQFGTFWVHTPGNTIGSVISYLDTIKTTTKRNPYNVYELLESCKGIDVILKLGSENIEGKVIDVYKQEVNSPTVDPANPYIYKNVVTYTGNLIHIQQKDGGHRYINGASISDIIAAEALKPNLTNNEATPTPCLDISFSNGATQQDLEVMYLQKGLSWMPFYNLELSQNGKARLELRSEVINEAEDIKDCDVNFVVGAPNFKYATSLTGLVYFINAQYQQMYGYQQQQQQQYYQQSQVFSNANYQAMGAVAYAADSYNGNDASQSFANNLMGDNVQDLYFYNLKNVTLKKGQRAHYEVFKTEVEFEHIYECDLTANQNQQYYYNYYTFDPNLVNRVFHSVKIKNESNNPFTTGPILVTEKRGDKLMPVCQDIMLYTPMKGSSRVRITNTSDIQVTHSEKELKRTENFKQWNGYYWDVLTVQATIKVKNYKKDKCTMSLHRNIYGEMKTCDADWKFNNANNPQYDYLNLLNNVEWTFDVKAGEEKEITYTFDYYWRR
jgi:hypothetical protein